MKRDYIEAEQIVERYLRNELSDAETEQFEQRLLWDTEVQDQLELTRRLGQGMRDAAADKAAPATVSWFDFKFLNSPRYAMAASVLLAVTSLGWLLTWLDSPPGDMPQASGRVFSLDVVRASTNLDELPLVTPGAATEPVTLLVYPDLEAHTRFRAALARMPGPTYTGEIDASWQPVWQGAPTASGRGDTVAVTLPGALLEPGVYRLRIAGWDSGRPDGAASDVYFRVSVD